MNKTIRLLVLVSASLLFLGGCAVDRSIITPEVKTTDNPATGRAVKVVKVEDRRVFELAPTNPDIPSLKDADITNKATTSRAMARKRNGYGMAIGDVLLPENQSVGMFTQRAVEQGLREAGYRVIAPGQPEYDQAASINISIIRFWAWVTPGFWALTLEHTSEVQLQGALSQIQSGDTLITYVKENPQMVPESTWRDIVNKGLAEIVAKVKAKFSDNKVANN